MIFESITVRRGVEMLVSFPVPKGVSSCSSRLGVGCGANDPRKISASYGNVGKCYSHEFYSGSEPTNWQCEYFWLNLQQEVRGMKEKYERLLGPKTNIRLGAWKSAQHAAHNMEAEGRRWPLNIKTLEAGGFT